MSLVRERILQLSGRYATGELLDQSDLDIPMRQLVANVCADHYSNPVLLVLIAIELAESFDREHG